MSGQNRMAVKKLEVQIHDDCWTHILMYGNKQDLGVVGCVSKTCKKLADGSMAWFYLCKFLWHDKQNCPLERWVRLETSFCSGSASGVNHALTKTITKSIPHDLTCIERSICELDATKLIIIEEMNCLDHNAPESTNNMSFGDPEQVARYKDLLAYKEKLDGRLVIWNANKQKCLEKMAEEENKSSSSTQVSSSQTQVKLTRQCAPLSRAVRAEWIRSTENEYFTLLDQIQALEVDLTSAQVTQQTLLEEDEEREILAANRATMNAASGDKATVLSPESGAALATDGAAGSTPHEQPTSTTTAPCKFELALDRGERRIKHLQYKINKLTLRADALQQQIVTNLGRAVDLRAEGAKYKEKGLLLTWKESYIASVVDSKRTICTPEELRELGDTIILFGNVLERLRFVRGGVCIFDNRSFIHRLGCFDIHGDEFFVPQVGSVGSVRRIKSDWGWEFPCCQGVIRMATYDRKKGLANHNGILSRDLAGNRWNPVEVSGPLLSSNPAYGLYNMTTINPFY